MPMSTAEEERCKIKKIRHLIPQANKLKTSMLSKAEFALNNGVRKQDIKYVRTATSSTFHDYWNESHINRDTYEELNSVNETIKVEDQQQQIQIIIVECALYSDKDKKSLQIASQTKTIPSENF